jgi:hypothetical protein
MMDAASRKLEGLVPPEKLKLIMDTYKIIKTYQDEMHNFPLAGRVKVSKEIPVWEQILMAFPDSARKEFNRISKALSNLQKTGYIEAKTADSVKNNILHGVLLAMPFHNGVMKRELTEKNRPNDNALDVLVYSLVSHVKSHAGAPEYSLIADFLNDQEIKPQYTYDDVRAQWKRLDAQKIEETYEIFKRHIEARSHLSEERSLPDWKTLSNP